MVKARIVSVKPIPEINAMNSTYYGFSFTCDLSSVGRGLPELERTFLRIHASRDAELEAVLIVASLAQSQVATEKYGNARVLIRYRGWDPAITYLRENLDNRLVPLSSLIDLSKKIKLLRVVSV